MKILLSVLRSLSYSRADQKCLCLCTITIFPSVLSSFTLALASLILRDTPSVLILLSPSRELMKYMQNASQNIIICVKCCETLDIWKLYAPVGKQYRVAFITIILYRLKIWLLFLSNIYRMFMLTIMRCFQIISIFSSFTLAKFFSPHCSFSVFWLLFGRGEDYWRQWILLSVFTEY